MQVKFHFFKLQRDPFLNSLQNWKWGSHCLSQTKRPWILGLWGLRASWGRQLVDGLDTKWVSHCNWSYWRGWMAKGSLSKWEVTLISRPWPQPEVLSWVGKAEEEACRTQRYLLDRAGQAVLCLGAPDCRDSVPTLKKTQLTQWENVIYFIECIINFVE